MTLKSAGFLLKMRYGKPPLSYVDQLTLLISRGLSCPDPQCAAEWLGRIGYYRLSAYFVPFKRPRSDQFLSGTTFADIVDLYKFDGGLRLLMLESIDRIEIGVRAAVTYHLSHDMGIFGYADPANYSPRYNHAHLMSALQNEERKTSEIFVRHYRRKYTSEPFLPVWMATELLSFGTLSKMYANLLTRFRKPIATRFQQPEPVFTSWLHTLAFVRNIAAHHGRLWNRELAIKPVLPQAWAASSLQNNRFYVVALLIETLLQAISPQSQWKERLKTHFNTYPAVNLAAMNFPPNWQILLPWSLIHRTK